MRRGYATGVFSSRGIARKLEEDVAFRMLAAGNFPKHRTICEFRHRHLPDFRALFLEVVRVLREMGLVRFGTLSIDGTKVRANASRRKAMSYEPKSPPISVGCPPTNAARTPRENSCGALLALLARTSHTVRGWAADEAAGGAGRG